MDDHTVTGRIFDILEVVGSGASVGLAELVAVTGLPKSTAHRMAEDLAIRGVLTRCDTGGYRLGPRISNLLANATRTAGLANVGEALHELNNRLGGITWYVSRADRPAKQPTIVVATGALRRIATTFWPDPNDARRLVDTASGNAVLSVRPDLVERVTAAVPHAEGLIVQRLSRARDRGAFYDDSYAEAGWRCVAVPIEGGARGVVGVTVRDDRVSARDLITATCALARDFGGLCLLSH